MQFKIEKITEDSFYLNLLIGLPKRLAKYKKFGGKGYYLKRFPPLTENEIHMWEHNNGALLPLDLRKFYNSSNGFLFKWLINYGGVEEDIVSKIEINPLEELVQLGDTHIVQITKDGAPFTPNMADVRIFELVRLGPNAKVVLVFAKYKFTNNIWLCVNESKYSFLTKNFTTYFRMCVAHLGIPNWQFLFTPQGPPQWTINLIRYLGPHLIRKKASNNQMEEHVELNKLNLNIFKDNYTDDKKYSKKNCVDRQKMTPKIKKKIK